MSSRKIKFGDKEVDKKEFYSSKQAISLDSADLNKILIMVEKICLLLQMMKKFIKSITKYGK